MRRWQQLLYEMKKKYEEKRKVLHQQLVSRMIKSADRRTGLLRKITKPTTWRGGVQILKEEEEKKKEWAKLWQCDAKVQDLEDKPWRNRELKNLKEDMPRLLEKEVEKAAKS